MGRTCDTAESPIASFTPDFASGIDSLPDLLRDAVMPFVDRSELGEVFAAIDEALERSGKREPIATPPPSESGREQIIAEVLRFISDEGTDEINARAAAINKQLGNDGRSDAAIGRTYDLTRAAINAYRRTFEEDTGIRCRASKSDQLRETCRRNRTDRRKEPIILPDYSPFRRAFHRLFSHR